MALGKNIKALREARGLTLEQLESLSGVDLGTISALEVRDSKRSLYAPALARALGVALEDLLATGAHLLLSPNTNDQQKHLASNVSAAPDVRGRVPLISWVQAGMWNDAVDVYEPGYAEQWIPVLKNGSPNAYALRVRGDSMTAAHGKSYPDGCIIIIDPQQKSPSSGARVIARMKGSGDVTFKVYVEEDSRRWLKPLNPQHPPISDEFEVIGTVTAKYEPE